jgi:hypothetical protein
MRTFLYGCLGRYPILVDGLVKELVCFRIMLLHYRAVCTIHEEKKALDT